MSFKESLDVASINTIVRSSLDITAFETLIDLSELQERLEESVSKPKKRIFIKEIKCFTGGIISYLQQIRATLNRLQDIEREKEKDIQWIFEGRNEILSMYQNIEQLDLNLNNFLIVLEKNDTFNNEEILDDFNRICELSVCIRKHLYVYKKKLDIAVQYFEINDCVINTIHMEIKTSLEQIDNLENERENEKHVREEICKLNFADIKLKVEQCSSRFSFKDTKFMVFNEKDANIYERFLKLQDSINPIGASIKFLPLTLEQLLDISKFYYPDIVLNLIEKYEYLITLNQKLSQELKRFRNEYITKRMDDIYLQLLQQVQQMLDGESDVIILSEMFDFLRKIGATINKSKHFGKTKILTEKFESKKKISIKLDIPKSRKNVKSGKRVFSNPLTDSMNMTPILFDTPMSAKFLTAEMPLKLSNYSLNENNFIVETEIIDKMKLEILGNISLIESNFKAHQRAMSTDSSPGAVMTKNIFDSPDPFITPNSRLNKRSKLPVSTPSTTPKVTPTNARKYVPSLPVSSGSKYRAESKPLKRNNDTPFLIFTSSRLSTTAASPALSMVPIETPESNTKLMASKIPLPIRSESRLEIIRSSSRISTERVTSRLTNHSVLLKDRPSSKLETLACNVSQKLGTYSPVIKRHNRPQSMLTQRERAPLRVNNGINNQLLSPNMRLDAKSLRARSRTAMDTRLMGAGCRITSI